MDVSEVYEAIKLNDIDTVSTYLDAMTNIKWENTKFVDSLLYHAIYYNRFEIMKKLICTYHANPGTNYDPEFPPFHDWALILAKERGSIKMREFLLNKNFMKES
jgi:ankyrin repeat protein